MEENIKILEGYLDRNTQLFEDYGEHAIIQDKEIQALENIIKGCKELEKQLDSSRKANELLNKTNNELRLEIRTTYSKVVNDIISKFNLGDEFIPKSKVKELHKEYYKKAFAEPYDCTTADYKHSQVIGGWRALNKLLMEDK